MLEQEPLTTGSAVLAAIPQKGLIRTCPSGCVHVTYGAVTLDFSCRAAFDCFVERLTERRPGQGMVQLHYQHALLRYSAAQFSELTEMAMEASRKLTELDVVRRLLTGFNV